ncbi:hypothetical protein CONLIGDRAFT_636389 [Coniochaeta ligniaria NRRL 30616]|uniref:Uncharacterized protein n=1 Tax=Coniochaeta ligniaria NRRL 30616 TaxID=1408157 RepID=A0A1J7J6B3_9PEZI|nr:hypothetical protein CONLIGDRAFT_636389 [Coniochaeta ligniaria NRRL 30616]
MLHVWPTRPNPSSYAVRRRSGLMVLHLGGGRANTDGTLFCTLRAVMFAAVMAACTTGKRPICVASRRINETRAHRLPPATIALFLVETMYG